MNVRDVGCGWTPIVTSSLTGVAIVDSQAAGSTLGFFGFVLGGDTRPRCRADAGYLGPHGPVQALATWTRALLCVFRIRQQTFRQDPN